MEIDETLKVELGSVLYKHHHCHCLPHYPWIWIAWGFSFAIIIACCTFCIIIGARTGWITSVDWCASLVWAILESILIIQPLKILILALLIGYVDRKNVSSQLQVWIKILVKHNVTSEMSQFY